MKIKTTSVDAILFTLMVLFPIFNMRALLGVAIIPLGDYINEIVYICLISLCGIRIMQSGRADKSIIWLLLFAGYFLLQIFVLNLPATSAVQAFLYLQAPIYLSLITI